MKNHDRDILTRINRVTKQLILAYATLTTGIGLAYAEDGKLEKIIVTAQKRSQSLQEVPLSVSAVTGDKLAEAGIENLQDLSSYIPNLKIVDGGLTPQMYIRGIGSGTNQGFEQSVGTYLDGIYVGRSLLSRSSFMDLERVEVLRGPQNILFGQSSIAGAISLVSAKPTDELEAMFSAKYTPEYNATELNGFVSGSLFDGVSARLALRDLKDDGYLKNTVNGNDQPELDEQSARLTFLWDVSSNFSATLKMENSEVKRRGRGLQIIDSGDYPLVNQDPDITFDEKFDLNLQTNEDNQLNFESENYQLDLNYELNNGLSFTSISSYLEYEYDEQGYDQDTSAMDLFSFDMRERYEQTSQEFRLTSPGGETIDYIAGIFYMDSKQKYQEDAEFGVSAIGIPRILDTFAVRPFEQKSETLAAFVQATWNVTDDFHATLGLRYSRDEKEARRSNLSYSMLFEGVLQTSIFPPSLGGASVANVLAQQFGLTDHVIEDSFKKTNLSPTVNIQYDLSADTMLYASYSEGYKTAGFDARGINDATPDHNPWNVSESKMNGENFQFDQENADSIEVGAKMTLLDGLAELNTAIYQTDYSDMQVSVFDSGIGFNVFNAAEATVRGVEMDGRVLLTDNLTLNFGIAYTDFEWGKYDKATCSGIGIVDIQASGHCDVSGRETLHTPEWTVNYTLEHFTEIGNSLELTSTFDANFKDDHYVADDLDARSKQGGATIYNARIALGSMEDTWEVALVAKNLTDKKVQNFNYIMSQSGAAGTDSDGNGIADSGRGASINLPRTISLEFTYRYW